MIIKELERELEGKKAGDSLVVTVAPEDAYNPLSVIWGRREIRKGVDLEFHDRTNLQIHERLAISVQIT